jgi:regulatory protein
MPILTKIEEQKNDSERVNIYIDDNFFIGTFKEIVYKLGLEEGIEVDSERLQLMLDEEMYLSAKRKAYNILGRAMQSEGQIRNKLKRYGYNDSIIERVIKNLMEYKLIDDKQMARSIIRDKKGIKKYGKNRILYELKNKKIDKKIINDTISEEINEDEEYENAVYLAEKKFKKIKDLDEKKIYQKLTYYLAYRGYDYNIIRKAVAKVMGNEYMD